MKPESLKTAFLNCVDAIQTQGVDPNKVLIYIFQILTKNRQEEKQITLFQPERKSIQEIIDAVNMHFVACSSGGSQLPVLAIYAIYTILVCEVKRYKGCSLCCLQSHTSADQKSGLLGDVQVDKAPGQPYEVVEIKHNIQLSPDLVDDCYNKFHNYPVDTYYLLSTNEKLLDPGGISTKIQTIQKQHGCQMIVNGIQRTLKYYLRLVNDPNDFLTRYISLLDAQGSYAIKMQWQNLWGNQ